MTITKARRGRDNSVWETGSGGLSEVRAPALPAQPLSLGEVSEGAVEAPSDRLVEKLRSLSPANV